MNTPRSGEESMAASVSLNDVAANVVKIHVDGVGRTKESLIMKTLASVFQVKHFEQLVLEAQEVKSKLLGKHVICIFLFLVLNKSKIEKHTPNSDFRIKLEACMNPEVVVNWHRFLSFHPPPSLRKDLP